MAETLTLRGELRGHTGWVTSIAAPLDPNSDTLLSSSRSAAFYMSCFLACTVVSREDLHVSSRLSSSLFLKQLRDHSKAQTPPFAVFRDKTVLVWHLTRGEGKEYGAPRRALKGHSHFVQDVVISSDGQFALSGSWDGTLRLWDLNTGTTTRRFIGHTKDVLSVAFSVDNRQVNIFEGIHDPCSHVSSLSGCIQRQCGGKATLGIMCMGHASCSDSMIGYIRPSSRKESPCLDGWLGYCNAAVRVTRETYMLSQFGHRCESVCLCRLLLHSCLYLSSHQCVRGRGRRV